MRVFLSWSGKKSKETAILLQGWLKGLIQATEPWISTNIETGASWSLEIDKNLTANFGIICLTKENYDTPWILFEAGALAKGLESNRVCTLLLDDMQLKQPLQRFQHTKPDREGMYKLVKTVNAHTNNKLSDEILKNLFDIHWPEFERVYANIEKMKSVDDRPAKKASEVLAELADIVKSFDKRLYHLEIDTLEPTDYKKIYFDLLKKIDTTILAVIESDIKQGVDREKTFDLIRQLMPPEHDLEKSNEYYNKWDIYWNE